MHDDDTTDAAGAEGIAPFDLSAAEEPAADAVAPEESPADDGFFAAGFASIHDGAEDGAEHGREFPGPFDADVDQSAVGDRTFLDDGRADSADIPLVVFPPPDAEPPGFDTAPPDAAVGDERAGILPISARLDEARMDEWESGTPHGESPDATPWDAGRPESE
ncbi:MAG: hypothetical protein EBX36_05655, partial [Planctomycetia bacterium]|nr:hypothetical protein [Planctomycetia bacterium]